MAKQLAYLEMENEIGAALEAGTFATKSAELLARRALAAYAAAALIMPYSSFAKAVDTRRYDLEALARQFGTSFEQTAHRITTLQRPGLELEAALRCRISICATRRRMPVVVGSRIFKTPRQTVTQWLELPDGKRFFSIARTVTAGGSSFGAARGASHCDRLRARACRPVDLYPRQAGATRR